MTQHSALTGSSLHENKGAAEADDDEVATATSGATVWKKLTPDNFDASVYNVNKTFLQCVIADVSTAEIVYVPIPFAGTLTKVTTVLEGTISGADSIITVKDTSGDSAGTITIANAGSLPGDIDTLTPVSNNTFTTGTFLTIETNGASTGTFRLWITLSFTITG